VAVVQLSKIQIRRGQKNTGSGLPQLASGELGWAIDTRELYIGNGAVSEGAPAVGNTKILTEYDSIFTLANTYEFKSQEGYLQTGPNSSSPIERSLQQRLDDRVSVKSFGAVGDGVSDDTLAVQRAIDQLYVNSATQANLNSRVKLYIEAGEYRISDTLYIPPFATIIGAGSSKTVFVQTVNKPAIKTVNGSSQPGSPADDSSTTFNNQAREIEIRGIGVNTSANQGLILENCRDSIFNDIKIVGAWTASDMLQTDVVGITLNSLSGAVSSDNNKFEKLKVANFSYCFESSWDITGNLFHQCNFDNSYYGIVLGQNLIPGDPGQEVGPTRTNIQDCVFYNISNIGIWVVSGKYNLSSNNSFYQVGTNQGSETSPVAPVIVYDTATNKSIDDYFSRTDALISGNVTGIPYIPEVKGATFYNIEYEKPILFGQIQDTRIFRLPGVENKSFDVNYSMVSLNYRVIRSGTLTVIVDGYQNNVEVSDDFHFIGDEAYLDSIRFDARLRDFDNDAEFDTIDVRVTSEMPIDDETEIKFTIEGKGTNTP
jgi:hypothetical protein